MPEKTRIVEKTHLLTLLTSGKSRDYATLNHQLAAYIQELRDQSQAWIRLSLAFAVAGFMLFAVGTTVIVNRPDTWRQVVFGALIVIWVVVTIIFTNRLSIASKITNQGIDIVCSELDKCVLEMENRLLKRKSATAGSTEIMLTTGNGESLTPEHDLTPNYLAAQVTPFLNAITDIQHVIDEIQGRTHSLIVIKEIQKRSPISVSLDGAAEAVQLVKDTVVPWRRKHAETMARLLEQEKQAEIECKKADILEKRAHAEKDRVEATKQRGEAEKLQIENEKLRLDLYRAKIQLALDMLAQVAPNLPEAEKIAYLVKLLPPLEALVSSSYQIATPK